MAVNLYHVSNEDGLFNILGKAFFAQQTINTARLTTIPTQINDVSTIFNNLTVTGDLEAVIASLGSASGDSKLIASAQQSQLQAFSQALLIQMVKDDVSLPAHDLASSLKELIRQMIASSDSVDASTVTAPVAAVAGNTSDGQIVSSTKRGDGLVNELMLAEILTATVLSSGRTASLEVKGKASEDALSADWPSGSGAANSIAATDASSSLLLNGDMEDEALTANSPDDWIISVGVIGTTVKMTDVEVQTLTVTSTPTSGEYIWQIPHNSVTKAADPVAYNASGSTLQAAIRALPGFESITVTTTGTTPNFTHTITFTGAGGNLSQHTITEHTDVGTYTPATTVAGTGEVFYGSKALILDSDGAELTTLNQRLIGLESETSYAIGLQAIVDSAPAAGVITVDLVDGIGGTAVNDSEGNANSFTIDATALTTSWAFKSGVFRTPLIVPDPLYIRIRISTAISNTSSVFIDQMAMAAMTEVYPGGPLAAAFTGATEWKVEDSWTITITNDRAGLIQEWFLRNFDLSGLGLLLPVDTGGSETIPDTVVS